MATVQRSGTQASECRRCRAFCDKLIEPRGCIELGCRFLYSYEDELTGGRFMGCLRKVFRAEIDVDMFELAEADGRLRRNQDDGRAAAAVPVPGRAGLRGRRPGYACVNPRFFDCTDEGPEGIRAFDLRNALP